MSGYQIIDLGDNIEALNADESVTIEGIYDTIKKTDKPIVVVGNGVLEGNYNVKLPFNANVIYSEDSVMLSTGNENLTGKNLWINSNNSVQWQEAV